MSETEEHIERPEASTTKTIVFLALVVLVVALLGFIIFHKSSISPQNTQNDSQTTNTQAPTSPDKVKSMTGANGDTMPSGTGTGQGSDNSLLGQ
jgi:hypothetical protein